jgi:DNA-binding LytR/AlgR family response regulator
VDKLPDLKLVQTFTEPLKALAEISVSNPVDIIFMDVEMPALSGIELAGLLRQKTRHLVFTTAHARYAIDAFKVEADAYLLKPYSILHFTKTINNLYPTGKETPNMLAPEDGYFFYIPMLGEKGNLVRVDLNELIAVEETRADVVFTTVNDTFLSSREDFIKTLKMLKKHSAFIQISDTVVIAKQHIKSVLSNKVLLSGETAFTISETHVSLFADFVQHNFPHKKP